MLEYLDRLADILADERELHKYYKGWCFHIDYLYADNPLVGDGMQRIHRSKNIFSCEAHHEVAVTNYNILIDGEQELSREYWEKLQKLFGMPV